jgi:peptidoglycan/LPS O-acetylase OafA/YrhL
MIGALRFFAILLVYSHHRFYPGGLGAAAITFFFALSGIIMAHSYNNKISPGFQT